MAHYAEINHRNMVIQVIPGCDEAIKSGMEQILLLQTGNIWKRTCCNTYGGVNQLGDDPIRKNFAGIGYTYDATRDAFIPPKPFPSWILNEGTCLWEPPVPYPSDGMYTWDEETTNWKAV